MKHIVYMLSLVAALCSQRLDAMYGWSIQKQHTYQLIQAATHNNVPALIDALNKGISPNVRNFMGESALALAIKRGNLAAVQLLLSYGASTIALDRDDNTALELAVINNQIPIIDLLIQQGIRVTALLFHYARHNSALLTRLRDGCNAQRYARESVQQSEPS